MATASRMSSALQPRDRSLAGSSQPLQNRTNGRCAGQPLDQLIADVARFEVGKDQRVARPATGLPGALL